MSNPSHPKTPWLRWHILRTLLCKEILRHRANRGGIALVLLLVVAALLLSVTGGSEAPTSGFGGGVKRCYIDYWERDAWIEHLIASIPKELAGELRIRDVRKAPVNAEGTIVYAQNTGGMQIRPHPQRNQGGPRYLVWVWHPGTDAN